VEKPIMRSLLLNSLALLVLGATAVAHDFWIEPLDTHPQAGGVLALRLRVGQDLQGDPVARAGDKIERFFAMGPAGELPAVGLEGKDPAGHVRVEKPGLYVIGYRSKHSFVELEPEKFLLYLTDEGLEAIIGQRVERGEATQKARERYSRCAKAIVATRGASEVQGFDRDLGLTFELIPEKNPCLIAPGGELPVRVQFEGKPIADVQVAAMCAADPGDRVVRRSDAGGHVTLPLARAGFWLVKSVHMLRSPDQQQAEWESFWASLTFDTTREPAAK
jgi:uncharacterized GH25 family protein